MADANEKQPEIMTDYTGLKAFWDKLNKNEDGVIDGKEWGTVVNKYLDDFKEFFPGETLKDIGTYFNKADMNNDDTISWSEFVAASDLGGLKKLYLSLDTNGDGKVSSKEFGTKLTAKFSELKAVFGGMTKAEVGKKFNFINSQKNKDSDGEQYLSWKEFHAAWFKTTVVPEFVDLRKLWDALEKNAENMVSSKTWGAAVTENQDLMKKLFGGSTLKEIGEYFNVVDADDNKMLSWREIVRAYTKAAEVNDLKAIFMEMDSDASGYVDSNEWGRQLNAFKDRLGNFFMGKSLGELGKMFNQIDSNHDDKLSWDEIKTAVRADQDAREEAEELAKVADIDAVNDAKISFLEENLVMKK